MPPSCSPGLKQPLHDIHRAGEVSPSCQRLARPGSRIKGLEKAASDIFRFIITRVYPPGLPGSLAVTLEEKGARLRLVFEDDGPPFDAATLDALSPDTPPSASGLDLSRLKEWSESVVYYRTPDEKNRLVTFYTL